MFQQGGVAWWAHIGGFIAGIVLVMFFARRRQRREYLDEYYPSPYLPPQRRERQP
jgi:membrane associated rhomboid family serine protease